MLPWLRVAYVIAKRELWAYLLSPITYLLATLFLVSQGYSFWLLLHSLNTRQASVSTLLSYLFGGTFLYWFFLLFLVAVLTMRLFAPAQEGDRRRSPRELLLSTAAPEGALVLGKHLGASALYCALWLPTLFPLALLRLYGGPAAGLPVASLACGYLGVFLTGQSALSVGLLASVLAPSQLLSATLSFVVLSLLLLSGLVVDTQSTTPFLRALLSYVNQLGHMDELARGIVDSRRVIYHASSTVASLGIAAAFLRVRPGNRAGLRRALLVSGLIVLTCIGVNGLADRHPLRSDRTQAREYSLGPELQATLQGLSREVHVLDLQRSSDAADRDELSQRWRETLLRAEQAAPQHLRVQHLDLDRQREQVRLLADRHGIDRDELLSGPIVVYSPSPSAGPATSDRARSVIISRDQLADFERSDSAPGASAASEPLLVRYHGESVLDRALRTVTSPRTPQLCFTRGHGESEHDSLTGSGGSELTAALRRENMTVRALAHAADLQALSQAPGNTSCDAVIISGPERAFLPDEVAALDRYIEQGGRLLALSGALIDRDLSRFLDTGLEDLLAQRGIVLGRGLVLDPQHRVGNSLAFVVEQGYSAHPLTAPLQGRRTLWPLVRPLFPQAASRPGWNAQGILAASEQSIAESDLQVLRAARDGQPDTAAPSPNAAHGAQSIAAVAELQRESRSARIVVFGSSQIAWNDTLVLYNRDLLLSAVRWLVDAPMPSQVRAKKPDQVRLVLTAAHQGRIFVIVVLGLPLLVLLLGLGIRWQRLAR